MAHSRQVAGLVDRFWLSLSLITELTEPVLARGPQLYDSSEDKPLLILIDVGPRATL
jgi:hypothetical protein